MKNYKYPEITEKIIVGAYKVHNTLGSGFLEKVYQNLLINFGSYVTVKRRIMDKKE